MKGRKQDVPLGSVLSHGIQTESEEYPWQKFCYRPGDEARELDLEEWRETVIYLLDSLIRMACGFLDKDCWIWGMK